MKHTFTICIAGSLLASALAEVTVKTEQLNPADPTWKFKTIPGPSKSDVAQRAVVSLAGNQWHVGGGGSAALVNGRLPDDPLELAEEAWLSNGNTNDGSILLDLSQVQPVAAVNTYSWHENPPDQGARGPQVYALSGSADGGNWTKLADVDTRPNTTGRTWNGQHGVSVADSTGELGEFRYLRFALQRTRSPLQPDVKVTGTLFAEIDVHTKDTLAKAGDATAGPDYSHIKEVIVVFKTHFDIGYTDMASNVVTKYRTTMMDQALKVVDANRDLPPEQQFVWTLPGWPMKKITEDWPGQTPERKQRVLEAFKDGRFVVHALPFTTHTELLEAEDLVRGMRFSSDLARAAGKPLPRGAKMTDVPSHSWILPALLRHAGVDFLHLGCNPASSSPQVPRLFWWEGPDGSRLLTMYTAESYGTGLVPPKGWPYKTWLALIHTGDNHGPPTPDEVKKLLDQAKQKLPGVKVRIGRLSDFADAILAEKADIPVVRGDMPDTWIHGPMSDPQGAKLARNIRPAITTAESLNTMLRTWGVKAPDIRDTVAKAYEQSLLYGEHTWGGSQSWITGYGKDTKWSYGDAWRTERAAGRFQRLESSWAEHTAYVENAQRLIQPVLEGQMKTLAESVAQSGPRIVVFNPLPWTRMSSIASLKSADARFSGRFIALYSPSEPPRGLADEEGLRFKFDDVPPLGYRTFLTTSPPEPLYHPEVRPEAAELRARSNTLTLQPRAGVLASCKSDGKHRGLAPGDSEFAFGQVLYQRFDSNNVASYVQRYVKINADWALNELGKPSMPPAQTIPYLAASPTNFTVRYTNSWIAAEGIMEAPASAAVPFGVTTRVIAYNTWSVPAYFDLAVTLHNKPADPWPEAAWICLPFDIESPQFRVGRLGSIFDPAKDIVPGANHDLFAVDTGIAVFGADGRGFGICPLDSPLVSLGEPGGWKYTTNATPKRAAVFVNLFNNQWTTNFRFWNEGTWTSRIRIWMFDAYDPWKSLIRPSLEARFPLQAAVADGPAGNLPLSASGLAIAGSGGATVTAFGANPEGPGTLLRVWEMAGSCGERTVTIPGKFASATPVNLRGEKLGQPLETKNGKLVFALPAYAPVSFTLE
jgi:alpha-mannosidase